MEQNILEKEIGSPNVSVVNSDLDPKYMRRAIELALKAKGCTNPNPMVGAVIVKDGDILAEGYHHRYGDLHAERDAIQNLKESAQGATIYVTLEPCCHYGKQPPCTQAIVDAGISKVVIGSRDPNPLVAGKGVAFLREHGIEVIEDYHREECDGINPVFFHYIVSGEPYVALKYAMTADGMIATDFGDSKWITGQRARAYVHDLRNYYTGILAGIGTVLADDPLLTCRLPGGRNPIRIIMDSHLKIPIDCNLVNSVNEAPLIVACLDKYLPANENDEEEKCKEDKCKKYRNASDKKTTDKNTTDKKANDEAGSEIEANDEDVKNIEAKDIKTIDIKTIDIKTKDTKTKDTKTKDIEAIRKKIAALRSMGVTVLGVAAQGSGRFSNDDLEDDHKNGLEHGYEDDLEDNNKENLEYGHKDCHKDVLTHETKGEPVDDSDEHISVEDLLHKLGKLHIDAVLVEGGKHINAAFIAAGKVNKIYTFVGAQIVGGSGTYTPVADIGISKMEESIRLSDPEIRAFDTDVLIEYEVQQRSNAKKIKNI